MFSVLLCSIDKVQEGCFSAQCQVKIKLKEIIWFSGQIGVNELCIHTPIGAKMGETQVCIHFAPDDKTLTR